MIKPNLNAMVLIRNGEISKIDMHYGDTQDEKKPVESDIEKLITLRDVVAAEVINFEKRQQQKFVNPDWKEPETNG